MAIAENQVVSIEYEVKSGSEVVDSNVGADPLIFMIGKQQIIPGLEEYVCTLAAGEKGDVLVPAAKAYGEYNDDALQEVPKEQFAGIELTEGMSLYGQSEDGGTVQVIVKEIAG
ncbi:MAG TPA: peptidylprolyl isomerase, partial [Sulfurimonas sp.]|nr:peptidylprolyl isomerase [Sulfurimonas sp.]